MSTHAAGMFAGCLALALAPALTVETSRAQPVAPRVYSKKIAEDMAAYARTLAAQRKRNVGLAADAVTNSRAFTEEEALWASPPLVDLIARDLSELLAQLEGQIIKRFDGSTVVLHTRGASIVPIEMTLRQRGLSDSRRQRRARG